MYIININYSYYFIFFCLKKIVDKLKANENKFLIFLNDDDN